MTAIHAEGRELTTSQLPASSARRRKRVGVGAWVPWIFLSPFIVVFLVFTAVPALIALTMSFTDIGARDLRNPLSVSFVGFATFGKVLGDPDFLRAVANTGLFVVLAVPTIMVIGFALALVLDTGISRLKPFFRAAVYLPVVTNVVAAAMIWQYAFTNSGPLNSMLESIGLSGANWLGDPLLALPTVASLGVWRNLGICMILFLAGLQAIPTEVREAAAIDGAGYWRTTFSITMPLLRPTTLLVSVLMMIFFLNIFDEPFLVTAGGPLGSTRSIALWVYNQFGFGNIGQSLAGSFLLLVLVGVVSFVQFRLLRPKF